MLGCIPDQSPKFKYHGDLCICVFVHSELKSQFCTSRGGKAEVLSQFNIVDSDAEISVFWPELS